MLGFKVEYEREEDKFIFLSLGNIQLMLEEGSEDELSQMDYPFGKGINFTFGVNNVDELYSKFKIKKWREFIQEILQSMEHIENKWIC